MNKKLNGYTKEGLPLVDLETINQHGAEIMTRREEGLNERLGMLDQENIGVSTYIFNSVNAFPQEYHVLAFETISGLYRVLQIQAEKNLRRGAC